MKTIKNYYGVSSPLPDGEGGVGPLLQSFGKSIIAESNRADLQLSVNDNALTIFIKETTQPRELQKQAQQVMQKQSGSRFIQNKKTFALPEGAFAIAKTVDAAADSSTLLTAGRINTLKEQLANAYAPEILQTIKNVFQNK